MSIPIQNFNSFIRNYFVERNLLFVAFPRKLYTEYKCNGLFLRYYSGSKRRDTEVHNLRDDILNLVIKGRECYSSVFLPGLFAKIVFFSVSIFNANIRVYNVDKKEISYSVGATTRADGEGSLPLPYSEVGDQLLTFLFFQSVSDPSQVSQSQFLGSVTA